MEDFVPIPHFLMPYHDLSSVPPHSHAHSNHPQPPTAHQQSMAGNMGLQNHLNENQNYEVTLNRWQPMHEHSQHVGQYIPSAETIPSLELKAAQASQAQNLHGKHNIPFVFSFYRLSQLTLASRVGHLVHEILLNILTIFSRSLF